MAEAPTPPSAEPGPPKPHELLSAALAEGRLTVERVAELLLRLRPEAVPPIAAGRVGPAKGVWKRLLLEIGHGGADA